MSEERDWNFKVTDCFFTDNTLVDSRLDTGERLLLEPKELIIEYDTLGNRFSKSLMVESGFVTDYSSFPWFARWLMRWDRADLAGVGHDFLFWMFALRRFSTYLETDGEYEQKVYPGDTKDLVHLDTCWRHLARNQPNRAGDFRISVAYWGLRFGSWLPFMRKQLAQTEERGRKLTEELNSAYEDDPRGY